MNTVEINVDLASALIDTGFAYDGWKNVTTIRGDEHRWYFDMTTIVTQDDETFYGFDWVDDKTEMGDLNVFEYTKGATQLTITAKEYKAVTKVIVDYIPVN